MIYFNKIIAARYQTNEFQVFWVFFKKNNSDLPDTDSKSKYIEIIPDDKIIHCGITRQQNKLKIYPNPEFILHQLNKSIEKIVLGGFHICDCVERIAKYFYSKGINVFVDEETTELFFCKTILKIEIPLIRTDFSLKASGIDDQDIEMAIEARKNKPWLIQK